MKSIPMIQIPSERIISSVFAMDTEVLKNTPKIKYIIRKYTATEMTKQYSIYMQTSIKMARESVRRGMPMARIIAMLCFLCNSVM